jgi:STE24 endopeptidase
MVFFYLILAIVVLSYLLEQFLGYLNSSYWSDELPKELENIYDPGKYRKSQEYEKHKRNFSILVETLTVIVMVLLLTTGGFSWLDNLVRTFTEQPIWNALLFFGTLGLVSAILTLPFDIYHVFALEEKFGFNRTTPRTFILDKLKGLLLAVILGGGLLSLIILIYQHTGNYFWVLAWGVISFFMIFITMFYSELIVPLFNKQKPLEHGALREAIEVFSAKAGFSLKNIYVIDGSKRSSKANAYFSGLGTKKRIVLFDTLIADHTVEELVAVLAHEIGHYKKKHTLQSVILSLVQTGFMFFVLSIFIRKDSMWAQSLCQALSGFSDIPAKQSFHLGVLAFGILYSPLSLLLGLLMNMLSRKNEYAADRFSGENYRPQSLMDALKKLSVNNLSNLRPHPAYVFFYYSHPTLLQRLSELEKIKESKI